MAIAGFNYGNKKRTEVRDEQTHTTFQGYYLPELPDYLRRNEAAQSLAPHAMTEYALKVARTEAQICNLYFGTDGFERLHLTEQPDFNFGQSWPNLVYLPISAYTDATQRYLLFGKISNSFSAFVEEVTPHEVSHQWWGHAVGWASYAANGSFSTTVAFLSRALKFASSAWPENVLLYSRFCHWGTAYHLQTLSAFH